MKCISPWAVILAAALTTLVFAQPALAGTVPKDINGDGRGDLAAMYVYGPGSVGFFSFDAAQGPQGHPIVTPRLLYRATTGWTGSKATPFLGEVTGDGRADIVTAYDYGSNTTGLLVVPGTATGSSTVRRWWKSAPGAWASSRTKWSITRHVNVSGADEPLALYDYGAGTSGLFDFTSSAMSFSPLRQWKSGVGQFYASLSKMIGGDFDGDGHGDAAVLYDYGGGTTGIWLFRSNGSALLPSKVWQSGAGGFPWANCKLTSGDFDLDGKDELLVRYVYGPGGLTGLWRFDLTGAAMTPTLLSKTYHFFWSLPVSPSDVDRDGRPDLCCMGSGTDDLGASWDGLSLAPPFDPLDVTWGLWESAPHAWIASQMKVAP